MTLGSLAFAENTKSQLVMGENNASPISFLCFKEDLVKLTDKMVGLGMLKANQAVDPHDYDDPNLENGKPLLRHKVLKRFENLHLESTNCNGLVDFEKIENAPLKILCVCQQAFLLDERKPNCLVKFAKGSPWGGWGFDEIEVEKLDYDYYRINLHSSGPVGKGASVDSIDVFDFDLKKGRWAKRTELGNPSDWN
jgi:hypothetical protein